MIYIATTEDRKDIDHYPVYDTYLIESDSRESAYELMLERGHNLDLQDVLTIEEYFKECQAFRKTGNVVKI